MEKGGCWGITRIHRLPSRPSHPYGRQPHSLIFMSTLYKASSRLPAKQLTNDHEPACMCHLYHLRINTHVLTNTMLCVIAWQIKWQSLVPTRMHSSRMPTVHCSDHHAGGSCQRVCLWGCTCWRGYLPGGVPARGCTCPGGCICPGGVPAGGVYPSMHWGRHHPLPYRMTDRCL